MAKHEKRSQLGPRIRAREKVKRLLVGTLSECCSGCTDLIMFERVNDAWAHVWRRFSLFGNACSGYWMVGGRRENGAPNSHVILSTGCLHRPPIPEGTTIEKEETCFLKKIMPLMIPSSIVRMAMIIMIKMRMMVIIITRVMMIAMMVEAILF